MALRALEDKGRISSLVLQPAFVLQEGFYSISSTRKISEIKYIADFQYIENGAVVVEDVKGFKTPVYILKKKMFLKRYPDLIFKEI